MNPREFSSSSGESAQRPPDLTAGNWGCGVEFEFAKARGTFEEAEKLSDGGTVRRYVVQDD